MKILYILNEAKKVNNFSYSSMIAAQQLNIEFHIAGNWGYESEEDLKADERNFGIKIHQIDFNRNPINFDNINAYKQLVDLFENVHFEIIHCNTPIGGVCGRLLGKRYNVHPVIYQVHGFHFYKNSPITNWLIYYPIEKILARITDAIITINCEDYTLAKDKLQLQNKGNVYYVPGVGIDLSMYENINCNCDEKRKELGISKNDTVLIAVGELNDNKNNIVLLKAVNSLKKKNIHLIICGKGENENSLKEYTKKNGLEKQVHFLGYRSDIPELLLMSDVFVMASYREGLSRSVMEAMACGLPCVVSRIRGNTDLIKDSYNGFTCRPESPEEFADNIKKLMNNITLYQEISKNNKKSVKAYEIKTIIEQYKCIYEDIMKSSLSIC